MRKAAILVDGSNMHATFKAVGFSLDWQRVYNTIDEDIPIHRAMYFTAVKPAGETSTIRPLIDFLEHSGWCVIQKPISRFYNDDGGMKIKGNMDVEMAVSAMQLQDKVSDIILFTGDGDFEFLVRALQDKGIRVMVVSSRKTRPSMISDKLIRVADIFVELVDVRHKFERILPPGTIP